jgi:hypothetical protein
MNVAGSGAGNGSRSESESVSQRYGSAEPDQDPYQNAPAL